MMRSLYSGVAGLKNHQTRMDVIGNNIANVNTTAYKTSRVVFQDIFSQTLRSAGGVTSASGGTNATQVGLGVILSAIDIVHTTGTTQVTDKTSDLMIDGDGFFVIQGADQLLYTRAGNLLMDAEGNLVTTDGNYVLGLAGKWAQAYDTDGTTRLYNQKQKTTTNTAGDEVGLYYYYTDDGSGNLTATEITLEDFAAGLLDGSISDPLDANGIAITDASKITAYPVLEDDLTNPLMTWEASTKLNLDGTINQADLTKINLSGFISIAFDSSGKITGLDANGERQTIGYLAIANFTNASGLEKVGSSQYAATPNSGDPVYSQASTNGTGKVISGALEMSNVDLASEFTDMIITQRGFQANSRIITTSDTMLEELVNLKR